MVDPLIAHRLDARVLLNLLPHMNPSDLHPIRTDFAGFLSTRDSLARHTTWQAGWNDYTGASPHQPGSIRYRPHRCGDCHGRRYDFRRPARNISRTGYPHICGACDGSGRGQVTNIIASYAPVPDPDEPTDALTEKQP